MKLGDKVELVLGIVIEDNDPKKLGRVKVSAPGYFDREVMSIEGNYRDMGMGLSSR